MKKIKDLIDCNYDIDIKGITDDSRLVMDGYLFVATKGYNVDHYDYIDMAINNGCSFIICDREIKNDFPHIIVDNINDVYRELCKKYYDVSNDEFSLIGITGTDGKTTTATIISKLIDNMAYLGTNGLYIGDKEYKTNNTTPCISELYSDLSKVKKNDCNKISMEVSSEALLHDRVIDFEYDIIGYTNITGDHLNVHKSFDNYVECKLKLLDLVKDNGYVVVNGDDNILNGIKNNNLIKYGFNKDNDYIIEEVKFNKTNTSFYIKNDNNRVKIISPLIGEYNVYNVTLAYIICLLYGVDKDLLINRIKELEPIKGRGELLDFGQEYTIVLDYAHTINGIKNILETFKDYEQIITVTGCAGGREKEKRPIIADIIMSNSDISIFTMDDPRYEDVDDIIDDMVGDRKDYIRIPDRIEAINYALSIANPNSVVLILGKGRDNYMAIEDKKIKYNDYDTICKYFE